MKNLLLAVGAISAVTIAAHVIIRCAMPTVRFDYDDFYDDYDLDDDFVDEDCNELCEWCKKKPCPKD